MNIYKVQPIFSHPTHPFELTIDAPGSKSITNRALMLAALANGETLLKEMCIRDRCKVQTCFLRFFIHTFAHMTDNFKSQLLGIF